MRRRESILHALGLPAILPRIVQAMDRPQFEKAASLVAREVRSGRVRAATLLVRHGPERFERAFGEADSINTIFLIASITKPMTAAGVMSLADAGKLSPSDPVARYIPEFRDGDRGLITLKHLLTHTSGLPDMLPENVELRRRHAPLDEFVAHALKTPLRFKPGTRTSYQSMGILLAAEVARRVAGKPFPRFLEEALFRPLGMTRTALGLGRFAIAETAQCQVEQAEPGYGGGQDTKSWNWNSPYWRNLAAPWGGAHSTAPDIARFLDYFLRPDGRVLRKETAELMVTSQTPGLGERWGIGFSLRGAGFGKGCSPRTFGHSGSTGTLCWADPAKDLTFVLLTTLPARVSNKALISPVSELVSTAGPAG